MLLQHPVSQPQTILSTSVFVNSAIQLNITISHLLSSLHSTILSNGKTNADPPTDAAGAEAVLAHQIMRIIRAPLLYYMNAFLRGHMQGASVDARLAVLTEPDEGSGYMA
ncbi:hypothetical protein ECG_02135 [Echinococcus granulosus]|nr:hypothetical protein ECG_02135 [Echinococcus granulosus]